MEHFEIKQRIHQANELLKDHTVSSVIEKCLSLMVAE